MPTWRNLWEGWKVIAFKIGLVQSRILLTVLYVIVVAPFGIMVRVFSDPLGTRRTGRNTYYLATESRARGVEDARRQY